MNTYIKNNAKAIGCTAAFMIKRADNGPVGEVPNETLIDGGLAMYPGLAKQFLNMEQFAEAAYGMSYQEILQNPAYYKKFTDDYNKYKQSFLVAIAEASHLEDINKTVPIKDGKVDTSGGGIRRSSWYNEGKDYGSLPDGWYVTERPGTSYRDDNGKDQPSSWYILDQDDNIMGRIYNNTQRSPRLTAAGLDVIEPGVEHSSDEPGYADNHQLDYTKWIDKPSFREKPTYKANAKYLSGYDLDGPGPMQAYWQHVAKNIIIKHLKKNGLASVAALERMSPDAQQIILNDITNEFNSVFADANVGFLERGTNFDNFKKYTDTMTEGYRAKGTYNPFSHAYWYETYDPDRFGRQTDYKQMLSLKGINPRTGRLFASEAYEAELQRLRDARAKTNDKDKRNAIDKEIEMLENLSIVSPELKDQEVAYNANNPTSLGPTTDDPALAGRYIWYNPADPVYGFKGTVQIPDDAKRLFTTIPASDINFSKGTALDTYRAKRKDFSEKAKKEAVPAASYEDRSKAADEAYKEEFIEEAKTAPPFTGAKVKIPKVR